MSEETIAKITITKQAEEAVSQIVSRVNDGFEAGRVNRQDVASWILTRFVEVFSDTEIQHIRAAFFNEVVLLEAILRRAKQDGIVPAELKAVLMGQTNLTNVSPKKVKKNLTLKSINDGLEKDGDLSESRRI